MSCANVRFGWKADIGRRRPYIARKSIKSWAKNRFRGSHVRVSILITVLAATTATKASADVIFCNATARATNQRFYTPFIDIGTSQAARLEINRAFEKYLMQTHPEGDSWTYVRPGSPTLSRSEEIATRLVQI